MFEQPGFALAGLCCMLAPVLLHLWRRRRRRVVSWAMMEFLQLAMVKRRRTAQLRDLLLLLARMMLLALFGAALAQPLLGATGWRLGWRFVLAATLTAMFTAAALALANRRGIRWANTAAAAVCLAWLIVELASPRSSEALARAAPTTKPIHLVLLIDDSLSMSYEHLGKTALDDARRRARTLIENLPLGSRVSLEPICAGGGNDQARASRLRRLSRMEAARRLDELSVVDRSADWAAARRAVDLHLSEGGELPPWFVFVGDQQRANWRGAPAGFAEEVNLRVVSVAPPEAENVSVARIELLDELADAGAPCGVLVNVASSRLAEPREVTVRLSVEGVDTASRAVAFPAGSAVRDVLFEVDLAGAASEPGSIGRTLLAAEVAHDRLPEDDRRSLLAPVANRVSAVMIDSLGDAEDILSGRIGETHELRSFLSGGESGHGLLDISLLRPEEATPAALAEARLVVLAGAPATPALVELLEAYVWQGGRLWLIAGEAFEPGSWSDLAWRNGAGLLPAPLSNRVEGLPPESRDATHRPWLLSLRNVSENPLLALPGVAEEDLLALYREPVFFQIARAEIPAGRTFARANPIERWPGSSPTPKWLAWRSLGGVPPAERATAVLARLDDDSPLLLSRPFGAGRVVLMTSSLTRRWSTLARANAFLLCDRLARRLLRETLPASDFGPVDQVEAVLDDAPGPDGARLRRPSGGEWEPLEVTVDPTGVARTSISRPFERGVYEIATGPSTSPTVTRFSVHGPAAESDLTFAAPGDLAELQADDVWVASGEVAEFRAPATSTSFWWWTAAAAVAIAALEMLLASNFQSPWTWSTLMRPRRP